MPKATAAASRSRPARMAGKSGSAATAPRSTSTFPIRSEEHTSELQSLMRISYAVFCLKHKKRQKIKRHKRRTHKLTLRHISTTTQKLMHSTTTLYVRRQHKQ